ncbi:protein of unknown function (plasmid) [Cupriavidus taiwanensis]|uniref:Uncharacterized protein n=1 Tax=Cupriavidus taiwanensis TaxID=164546 RepID=A0A375IPK9_9BURK|nr:protein of unknown function [Cupriavidus taiwanensis]
MMVWAMPRKSPVPMAPPRAISWMCRFFSPRLSEPSLLLECMQCFLYPFSWNAGPRLWLLSKSDAWAWGSSPRARQGVCRAGRARCRTGAPPKAAGQEGPMPVRPRP